jgi:hypothetical protein
MVLMNNQTQSFFKDVDQMNIPNTNMVRLQAEGILTVDDLVDFDKDTIQQVADNLRHPGGRIQDPTQGAAASAASGAGY